MPQNPQAVQELFQQALDRPADERAAFLDSACDDPEVRAEVDALLLAYSEAEEFLAEPTATGAGEQAGDVIDRYRLLEEVGEGGFGVVWMAEQLEPVRRRVAIKIIKLGMDTRQVVARFEAERQALALMDHPNIAKVLDGGSTPAGRPYFVMELVRGLPVTEFCDQTNLDTPGRLELFQRICLAVEHAHQKGVIHRDLKPSNILVTLHDGEPVPKVIDFGVAKATTQELTQRTLFTQFRQMVGTPEYMAPEQAEMSGLDVDTRADVYSLGVILYELLTGTKPFEVRELLERGYDEMLRHLRETEPQKPSTRISSLGERLQGVAERRRVDPSRLGRLLRGELDWIAMRALEKQRTRRYPTVRAFSEDLRRFLADEPVAAGPPTASYRALKLLRRHRTLATTAALVLISLLGGVIATGIALQRARDSETQERQARQLVEGEKLEVERQARRAELVIGVLGDMLGSSDPHGPRRPDMLVRELLDEFERGAATLDEHPEAAATIRTTVGTAYRNLGLLDKSEPHLRRALDLRRDALGNNHPLVAQSLSQWAWQQHDRGDYETAIKTMHSALAILGHADDTESATSSPSNLASRGAALSAIADFERHLGRFEPSLASSNLALELLAKAQAGPVEQVGVLQIKGSALVALGRYEEAERTQRHVVELLRAKFGPRHLRVSNALSALGDVLMKRGRYAESETAHRDALTQRREFLAAPDRRISASLNNLAGTFEARGDWENAETHYRESLATDPDDGVGKLVTTANLGMVLMRQNDYSAAEPLFVEAIAGLERELQPNHPTTAMILQNHARLLELTGRYVEAEEQAHRVVAMRRRSLPPNHPHRGVGRGVYGMTLFARGKHEEAERELAIGERILRAAFGDSHGFVPSTLNNRAIVLRALGRFEEAERLLEEAATMFEKLDGRRSTWAEARIGLAHVMLATDRLAAAEPIVREVVDILETSNSRSWQRRWAAGTLGLICEQNGDRAKAIERLDWAVRDWQPRRAYEKVAHRALEERLERLRDTGK
ncbi:MAG: tetratricopeptide repeat protein [bacterium]|nr:tetratricopeptide repeat protein [bacterium]